MSIDGNHDNPVSGNHKALSHCYAYLNTYLEGREVGAKSNKLLQALYIKGNASKMARPPQESCKKYSEIAPNSRE